MPDQAARPFSIRIFVPGGDPDGLRIVEKSNWTGVGVAFNRGRCHPGEKCQRQGAVEGRRWQDAKADSGDQ